MEEGERRRKERGGKRRRRVEGKKEGLPTTEAYQLIVLIDGTSLQVKTAIVSPVNEIRTCPPCECTQSIIVLISSSNTPYVLGYVTIKAA